MPTSASRCPARLRSRRRRFTSTGKFFTTLKGDHIVEEFQVILDNYVEKRYGQVLA